GVHASPRMKPRAEVAEQTRRISKQIPRLSGIEHVDFSLDVGADGRGGEIVSGGIPEIDAHTIIRQAEPAQEIPALAIHGSGQRTDGKTRDAGRILAA